MTDFKKGDKVVFAAMTGYDEDDHEQFVPIRHDEGEAFGYYGKIKSVKDGNIEVTWKDKDSFYYFRDPTQEELKKYLMLESDFDLKVEKLEQEYNEMIAKLSPKMDKASELLLDIEESLKKNGYSLHLVPELFYDFKNIINENGWNSSSYAC